MNAAANGSEQPVSGVLPGAEPWSTPGAAVGVLVLHGFTGNPSSVRPLAEAFAAAGHAVEMPRLPGHGTVVEDLMQTTWEDWSAAAEAALGRLADRTEVQFVAGLSMGGSLSCWLAVHHPELAGVICVNPAIAPVQEMRVAVQQLVDAGETVMTGIGSDIADPDVVESAYADTPLAPLLTLFDASAEIVPELGAIAQPLLLFTSPEDHVVPPTDSDMLEATVSGPVERVSCARSYHVATLDYDRELICERSVEWVAEIVDS